MKITNEFDTKAITNAFVLSVAIAQKINDKKSDDLLFVGLDEDKDARAKAYDEENGIHGYFNKKSLNFAERVFADENDKRMAMINLLGEYLAAFFKDGKINYKPSEKEFQLDAYEVKISKTEKKTLGRDLYLKLALLPKHGVDFKTGKVIDNEFIFLIDFHD